MQKVDDPKRQSSSTMRCAQSMFIFWASDSAGGAFSSMLNCLTFRSSSCSAGTFLESIHCISQGGGDSHYVWLMSAAASVFSRHFEVSWDRAITCHSFSASEPQTRPTPAYMDTFLSPSWCCSDSSWSRLLLLVVTSCSLAARLARLWAWPLAGGTAAAAEAEEGLSACTRAERMATANSAAAPEIHPNGPE